MQNKAWNQYSSSSDSDVENNDNDSWFDDEKEQNSKTQQNVTQGKDLTTKVEETTAQTKNQETKTQKVQNKVEDNQKKYEKRKFPTDDQLLNLYESKQVDNTKAIKVAKVNSEQTKQIIKNTKTRKTVELAEDAFILFFETEEDLINFIKLKIEKRSRFFLQQFYENKNKKIEREERYKNRQQNHSKKPRRDQPRDYPDDENKRDRPERKERVDNAVKQQRQRPKKRYEKQEDSDKQEKKQVKITEQRKQAKKNERQEEKIKKVYLLKQHFQIPQKSNNLIITSDKFQNDRILEALQKKRVIKDFAKFYIEAPFYTLKKVALLCSQIVSKKKFYLQKEPAQEGQKDSIVKLTMIQNLKKHQTDSFVQRYKPKVQGPQQSHIRILNEKSQEYFKNIDKYNVSEIAKGFDQNKYITQLREAGQNIQKQWNCWKIQAEDDSIQVLLRLVNRIKKNTIYDVQLKASLRNEKPLLAAELKQRPQKERRPKVDVSNVNNYLS